MLVRSFPTMPFVSVTSNLPSSSKCPPNRRCEACNSPAPTSTAGYSSTSYFPIMKATPKGSSGSGSFVAVTANFQPRRVSQPSGPPPRVPQPTPSTAAAPVESHRAPKRQKLQQNVPSSDGSEPKQWWISRALRLKPEQRNGWVAAHMLEEYRKEELCLCM